MPRPSRSPEFARALLRSPVWGDVLERVGSAISGASLATGKAESAAVEAALGNLAIADVTLLAALDCQTDADKIEPSELEVVAAELLASVAEVWAYGKPGRDRRSAVAGLLARRLSAHEFAVLQGELIYSVSSQEATKPASRLRELAVRLSAERGFSHDDLVSLQEAALEIASLQVRAAGNIATGGQASEAPESRSGEVDDLLRSISAEVSVPAKEGLRRAPAGHDVVALHLGTGMRLLASRPLIGGFESGPSDAASQAAFIHGARESWLELARLEHVAVSALDRELETPTYEERFGSLTAAIAEGAANVVYGGRLVSRPQEFRHDRVWTSQAITLSYALEAYIRGLRGIADGFAQAQLIVLTRLVRAVAAVALIDLHQAASLSGNGRMKR